MPSLLDVAPPEILRKTVDIRGTPVDVQGIPGVVWQELYAKYPTLGKIVQTGSADGVTNQAEGILATAAVIAAGTGHHGEVAHQAAAARLSSEEQAKLLEACMQLSYPAEIFLPLAGPEAAALLHAAHGAPDGRASDTNF